MNFERRSIKYVSRRGGEPFWVCQLQEHQCLKDLLSKKEKQRVTKPLSCLRFGSDANILKRSSKWKVPGMEPDFSETSKIEQGLFFKTWPVIAFEYCFHFSVLADIHGLDTSPLSASLVENKCCTPSKRERKPLSSFWDRLWQLFPPSIERRKYLKWVFLHLLSICYVWCNKYSLESVALKNYGPIQSLGSHTSAQDAILSSFDVIHHDGNWKQNFYGLLDIPQGRLYQM